MADPKLINYIRQQLGSGYDLNTIRNHLIRYGYPPNVVDETINIIYQSKYTAPTPIFSQPTSKANLSIHKLALITAFIFMISSVVMFTYILMSQNSPVPNQLLDIDTESLSQSVKIGNNFEFLIKVSNMGMTKRYDIKMVYEVLDLTGNLITKKEESIGVETSVSKKAIISIPDDIKPGQYTLKTTAKYNGQIAESSFLFKVKKEVIQMESCNDRIKNQDETDIDCGGTCEACPSCFDEIKNQGESIVDCGGPCEACLKDNIEDLTTAERVAKIKEAANNDVNEAIALCASMIDQGNQDNCYRVIAETIGIHSYCDYISNIPKRNACYLPFLMRNDFSVCSKITDLNLLQMC